MLVCRWNMIFCLFLLLNQCSTHDQKEELSTVLDGLSLDELEMLEDYELKQLRDFVKSKGRGSVSRAAKDEDINLFGASSVPKILPSSSPSKMVTNGTERVDFGAPIEIQPMMITMPDQLRPLPSIAHAAPTNNKKPKLKLRRKNGVEKPKKDEQQTSASNGLREETEQSNRSDDLTGEDYEKLAKLLQTFVNRRKITPNEEPITTTQRSQQTQMPTLMTWPLASSHSTPTLPPWAVTLKSTTEHNHAESRKGLSKITEQDEEEEATFVVGDNMQKPEPASIWRGHKTTTQSPISFLRKFDLKERKMEESRGTNVEFDPKLSLIDNEVERDPKDWEIKMRQLSRELSTILHRLKTDKEQKGELPKTEYKVAVQSLNPVNAKKTQVDNGSVLEVIDQEAGENETQKVDNDKDDIDIDKDDKGEQQEDESPPKSEASQRISIGALKINKKTIHESSTNGKAYVTILREGIARQTDINEYVFIASITLVRDANKVILVDTGLATDINGRTDLLTKLSKLDIAPPNVNYVITSHGHPDHAGNTNDFPDAIHFQGNMLHHHSKFNFSDLFEKDQHQLTKNVQLIKTPGHTPDDITVLVKNTDKYGTIAVCGDVFVAQEDMQFPLMWKPMAWSERTQETSRKRLICDSDYIVPGHGKVFKVTDKMRSDFNC